MNSVNGKSNCFTKCRVILHQCLAIVVRKEGCKDDPGEFWMYENGYLLFQGLLSSNSVCWWNSGLNSATKSLVYYGYVSPGALLIGSEPCAIDILKNAWSRRVLQPPPGYQVVAVEEIDSCFGIPVNHTQWTPLPEAVCAVVLRLSRQGKPAGLETIREALILAFPHVSPPTEQTLYDTLAQLTTERKLYHSSRGYFIVTPERRRSRSHSRGRNRKGEDIDDMQIPRSMLMSTEEALVMVHGDMATIRDGDVTHQIIQTNLADVICGGNASDKVLYPRKNKTFAMHQSPDRRSSFRLWRSSRRLRRSASTRSLAKNYTIESNSSTDRLPSPSIGMKKESLLSRLFRKPKRTQCQIQTFSAQFPPTEWFNSKAVHLHSIGTQTTSNENEIGTATAYLENCERKTSRAATLPRRRQCCQYSELPYSNAVSRENSPLSRKNPSMCTLPQKSRESSRKTSRSSLIKAEGKNNSVNKLCDSNVNTSQKFCKTQNVKEGSLENSGPSSIESHKDSSITSGPSSLESHKTVINRSDLEVKKVLRVKSKNDNNHITPSNSFTLQVTTNQAVSQLNNKPNATTTTTINREGGNSTKIFVQNSPVRSVITFENGQCDATNPNLVIINDTDNSPKLPSKNTNQSKVAMNNNRKLSLQLPSKDINFHNIIKNVSSNQQQKFSSISNPDSPITEQYSKDYTSIPSSPSIKSSDTLSKSIDKIFIKNYEAHSKTSCSERDISKRLEKNILGSEPNISYKQSLTKDSFQDQQFPSLNDLTFNFTSLAAQKILKGVGLNSADTLVELNMTSVDKQNNCDVVHTDFGLF